GVGWAYVAAAVAIAANVALLSRFPAVRPPERSERRSAGEALAGFAYIRKNPTFLAAMTLDLFAVLLGGVVALLPIFARDILKGGPVALGWLNAAPSAGALAMALVQTRLAPWRRPGRILLAVVAGFGAATIGFGLARSLPLALFCLFLTGGFD